MDDSISDLYYLRLPSGPPTQGDIWQGLPAVAGNVAHCTGIIITPRCDLAHDKTPVINYLPIISLDEYCATIGGFTLIEQEISNLKNQVRNIADSLRIAEIFDLGIPSDEIVSLIRDGKVQIEGLRDRAQKQIEQFEQGSRRLRELNAALAKPTLLGADLAFIREKDLIRCKRELVRNAVADTVFFPPCPPLLPKPSVALLRLIYTCRRDILQSVMHVQAGSSDSVPVPERLLRLKSPHVEALVARMAALFTRVGLRDLPADVVDDFAKGRE